MPGPSLGHAVVEVGADTSRIKKDVNKGVKESFRNASRGLNAEGDKAAEGWTARVLAGFRKRGGLFSKEGEGIGKKLGDGIKKGSGGNKDGITSFGQLSFSLGKFAAASAGALSAITPLPTALVGVVAGTVAVAGAVGQASGALISLAGVGSSLGIAFATVKIGSMGLKDAFKAQSKAQSELAKTGKVSAATQEELAASMKGLSPAAQQLVKAVSAISPAWKDFQKGIQGNLLKGFGSDLQRLSASVLPGLRSILGGVATDLNQTARGWVAMLTSAKGQSALNAIMAHLAATLRALLPAIAPIAKGLGMLFWAALPSSTALAKSITDIATRFQAWSKGVSESGRLASFLVNARAAAGNLMGILGNLGSILATVFGAGAAQGNSMLGTFKNLTGQFAAFLKSAEGQDKLASFFSTIGVAAKTFRDIMTVIGPVLSGVFDIFKTASGPMNELRAALLPVAQIFATQLGAALTALAPLIATLISGFAGLVRMLTPIAPQLAAVGLAVYAGVKAYQAYKLAMAGVAAVQKGYAASTKALASVQAFLTKRAIGTRIQLVLLAAKEKFAAVQARLLAAGQRAAAAASSAWAAVQRGLAAVLNGSALAAVRQKVAAAASAVAQRASAAATAVWTAAQSALTAVMNSTIVTTLRAKAAAIASAVAAKVVAGAQKAWAAAQWLLNAALTANPIGIIVVAIAAFVAAIIIAYKKSDTFRSIVNKAWAGIKMAFQATWKVIQPIFRLWMDQLKAVGAIAKWLWENAFRPAIAAILMGFGQFMTVIGKAISAAGKLIPGMGAVGKALQGAGQKALQMGRDMDTATKPKRKVDVNTKKAIDNVRGLVGWIGGVKGKTVTLDVSVAKSAYQAIANLNNAINKALQNRAGFLSLPAPKGHATGGVASGGVVKVGERGPELVRLPKGSRVHTAQDTRRMMKEPAPAAAAGPTVVNINQVYTGPTTSGGRIREISWALRYATRTPASTTPGLATA